MRNTLWAAAGVLILARGAATAGDDDKDKKPAAPVDVPGFWTADELRRIDEGLDVLNCTRKDLGFQKRPIDDPFRLPVVNQILDDPLSIGPVAAEWDAVARTGDPSRLITEAWSFLPKRAFGDRFADEVRCPALEARLAPDARQALRDLLSAFRLPMEKGWLPGRPEHGAVVMSNASLLRKALLSQVEKPQVSPDAPDVTDSAFLEQIRLTMPDVFYEEARDLVDSVANLVRALQRDKWTWVGRETFETSKGKVVLYGVGDDIHGPEDDDAVLVIDLGGNDTYTHGASANLLKNHPVSVVIDLAGNDSYLGENDFSFGGALGGVAIQWDCGGNDTYRGGNCSCGAGILGVGVLVDEGGDDVYRVKDFGEGAGAFGIGLLLDKGGNDTYHADLYGQGFGSTWGCGMLVDLAGNDCYDAGGVHVHAPLWRDRYESLSQGFAIGMRPDASGGVGVLVDVSGNDRYSCDIFGQGASYWYSLGLLIDDDGHDTYCCGQYGQGAGIHLSCGMLLDRHGQDCYYDANGVGMGGAHDFSVGVLVDREGDDYYCGGGGAQGGALTNSVAILLDDAGDDSYAATRDGTQGSATAARNTGGIGMLLDSGGHDRFTETTRAGGVAVKDIVGACIDEPTPPDAAHADPMNAAISDADAMKKVEADGMTDGKWDLEKLWKLVTAWEVGDNTKIMPKAREKFVALGKPALDRAFEHFDAKDSLLTRAIEKTLEAFPRDEWTPRLLEKTKDADKIVRKNAVLMVTNLKVAEALPRLTEMLTSDVDTQTSVLAALAALKTAPSEVVALLKAPKESVGVQAAVCLGAVGDDRAIDALVAALGPDFAFPVRLAATEQIGSLGARAAIAVGAVAGNPSAPLMRRRNALRALGASKNIAAAASLVNSFNDPDRWIRFSGMLATSEFLKTFPSVAPPGADDDAKGALRMRADLESAFESQRAAETDPLVKRLVLSQAKK